MNEVFLIPIIAIGGSFTMVVAIVWLGTRAKQRRDQLRADVQMKLIEKFSSSADFVRFLESPAGRQFLQDMPTRSTRDRILWGIRTGVVLTFLGFGFAVGYFVERDAGFFIPAFILIGLGLGFLLSSAISWKLAKQWNGTQQPPSGGSISAVSS
jgi:hypothetical protein